MLISMKRKYARLVMLVIMLLSLIATVLSYFIATGLLRQIIVSIGVSGFATSLISYVNDISSLSASDEIVSLIRSETEKSNKFASLGLVDIDLARTKTFRDMLQGAKSLDIMFNSGLSFTDAYEADLITAVQKNCRVRILLNNPDSPILNSAEDAMEKLASALCPNSSIRNEILSTKERITHIAKQKKNAKVTLKYMVCFPTGSLVIFNRRCCVYTPYLPYSHSKRSICFQFEKNGSEVFALLQATFDNAFSIGLDVTI